MDSPGGAEREYKIAVPARGELALWYPSPPPSDSLPPDTPAGCEHETNLQLLDEPELSGIYIYILRQVFGMHFYKCIF